MGALWGEQTLDSLLLPTVQTGETSLDTHATMPAQVGPAEMEPVKTENLKRRVKLCPVCGINPLPQSKAACSDKCRKRKERLLRKAHEESLLYYDEQQSKRNH